MPLKLTRRQLAAAISAQLPSSGEELLKQARERVRRDAEQLTKREVPTAIEPAFVFKA